ncbi:hypothetical protein B0619_07270 [Campylobacter lari]|nr:hypothetical protein [Campylobacter lari]EAK5787006.1 hypothetical protein [Campylobacter lari]
MKKIFASIFLIVNLLVAQQNGNPQGTESQTTTEEMKKVFVDLNDDVIDSSRDKDKWVCRKVKEGYATQIIGFDFKSGTTFCRVYKQTNFDLDLKFDASQTNVASAREIFKGVENELKKYENTNMNTNLESKIEYTSNNNQINFAKFLISLATLNPNIIDREKTYHLGELTLKDGIENFSIRNIQKNQQGINQYLFPNTESNKAFSPSSVSVQETSAVDGFNKANMGYFSNLYLANEKIYSHLQVLILILVGGFFVTSISAEKIQAYLENRGESEGKQKFLHKFYIPMIMIGTFFMPIPEANGLAHSTIMQNVIRYFALKSTDVADRASAIGGKAYMDKIYKSLGGINIQGIKTLIEQKKENDFIIKEGDQIYKKTCSQRYTEQLAIIRESYVTSLTEDRKEQIRRILAEDKNNLAGSRYDISLEACISLENQILNARSKNAKLQSQLERIEKFKNNTNKINEIKTLDTYFATREMQLGWINSLFTPTSAILAEVTMFKDELGSEDEKKQKFIQATKKNIENTKEAISKGEIQANKDDVTDSSLGWLSGKLVWMMLPGASAIKDFVMDNLGKLSVVISAAAASTFPIVGTIAGGIFGYIIGTAIPTITGYSIAIMLIEWTFQKIPLLVCTTASVIAFVSYLVSLIKYFYISPFVVAFSLATKRMDKIIEFLINGIAIFLKPTLIILFIYLSLFVNVLVDEFFLFISVEQFTGVVTSVFNFHTNFVVGAITGLLTIFAKIASAIIIWHLIIKGASWALSLVGIDGKQSEMISQGMENTLNKRANIV